MPEDVFATLTPMVLGAKEQGVEQARAAQEAQFQQQQRAQQKPIDDLARQVKMQQLKDERASAPSIAKLLSGTGTQAPQTPGQPGAPGPQQPSPQEMYAQTTQAASNVWSMATDPNNPRNLL
jgi:hypothetical protein